MFKISNVLGGMLPARVLKSLRKLNTPVIPQAKKPVDVASVQLDHVNSFTRQELKELLASKALEFDTNLNSNFSGKVRIKNCLDDLFGEVLANVGDVFTREKQNRLDLLMEGKVSSLREKGHEPELQLQRFPSEHQLVLNIIDPTTHPRTLIIEKFDLRYGVLNIYKFNEKSKRYLTQQIYYNRLPDGGSQEIQILYDPVTGRKTYFSIDGMPYKLDKQGKATLCDDSTNAVFQSSKLLEKVPNLFELIINNTVQASPSKSSQQGTTSLVNSLKEWCGKVVRNPVVHWVAGIGGAALTARLVFMNLSSSEVSMANNAALQPSSLHQERLVPITANKTPPKALPATNLTNHQTVIFTGAQLAKDCPLKAKSKLEIKEISPLFYTVPGAEFNCSPTGMGLTFKGESPELKVLYSSRDYNSYFEQITIFSAHGSSKYQIKIGDKEYLVTPDAKVIVPLPGKITLDDLNFKVTRLQP